MSTTVNALRPVDPVRADQESRILSKETLRNAYRRLLPVPVRAAVSMARADPEMKQLRQEVLAYYRNHPAADDDTRAALRFLKRNPITVFPYRFHWSYSPEKVVVRRDASKDLPYSLLDGKRLYFRRSMSDEDVRDAMVNLQREQDTASPHRYLTGAFDVREGDAVADVGAADGNFALQCVERAGRVTLFEPVPGWLEPLRATFEPWKEKVEIVPRFVGDEETEACVSIDRHFDGGNVDFLKIDVEGAEDRVLRGARASIDRSDRMRIALCVYHQQADESTFRAQLTARGFSVTHSRGYMLFLYGERLEAPYFRRGLLRASRI